MKIFKYLILVSGLVTANAADRTWTDNQGREVVATLVKVENENVILKKSNGQEIPFPLNKLSEKDQVFAKQQQLTLQQNEALNFDAEWPKLVRFQDDPEIEVIKEDKEKNSFIYESVNYRYNCDVRLNRSVVKGFAVMFEATHQYIRELPLAVNGGKKRDGKYQILLFKSRGAYEEAGGPPSSSGVYFGRENLILVPLTSLGVKPLGSGYMLDRDRTSKTLPHEIVHQLTPPSYYSAGASGWFTEGIAEYVANTPYRGGGYNVRMGQRAFIAYVTEYGRKRKGGRALGETIHIGPLRDYMMQSYRNFTENGNLNYGVGLLMVNYFCHMDRKEDGARLKKFLRALREGKKGEEALEALRDGQSWPELEEKIADAYKSKGIELIF